MHELPKWGDWGAGPMGCRTNGYSPFLKPDYYLGGGDDDIDVEFFRLPSWPRNCIPPEMRLDSPTFKLNKEPCSPSMFVWPPECRPLFEPWSSSFAGGHA